MEFKVTGKLEKLMPVESGTSEKTGKEWTRQSFVINTGEQYNATYYFSVFGQEKINGLADLKHGQQLTVSFNIDCRKSGERYFTNLQPWKIMPVEQQAPEPVQASNTPPF